MLVADSGVHVYRYLHGKVAQGESVITIEQWNARVPAARAAARTSDVRCCTSLSAVLVFILTCCFAEVGLAQRSSDAAAGLVGTWMLAAAERDVAGEAPTAVRGARGLLVIDSVGNVFEFFEVPSGVARVPEDRREAYAVFGGFWGSYEASDAGRIDFRSEAGVSPSVRGISFSRTFELDGDRLVMTSAEEPQAQADKRFTWQRVPTVENLSPMYREVIGFWRHTEERRVNLTTGEIQTVRHRDPSVIVYTPAGYFGVHFPAEGRAPFAAGVPSAEEAQAAFRSYIGYYGALTLYPGEVAHNVLSGTQPSAGSILRRFADISGDEAVLTIPSVARASDDDSDRFATTVHMRRLSGIEEMTPR